MPSDRLTGLKLGNSAFTPLKTFLQKHAQKYEAQNPARTYAAFKEEDDRIVGYVTLVCGEVVAEESDQELISDPELDYNYSHYPAVKIARLAIDYRVSGQGLGRQLVNLSLGQAKSIICPAVGCRFVMVDSKQESVGFYKRCGFTMLNTSENKKRNDPVMWIDLSKI